MNKIIFKNRFEELNLIIQTPILFLANYFIDLKTQVDFEYSLKLHEKDKYIEIINQIELFEENAYKNLKSKCFNKFNKEIQSLEEQLNDLNINKTLILLDELQYDFEKILFSNKSILFTNDLFCQIKHDSIHFISPAWPNKEILKFAFIINDEYLRKSTIYSESFYLTREKLIDYFFKKNIFKMKKIDSKIVNLDICILKENKVIIHGKHIKEIHPKTFIGLTSLMEIHLHGNQIKEIDSNTFNGLINLKIINFKNNKIKELHSKTFNGLISLEIIDFSKNQIVNIDPKTFESLKRLQEINFHDNRIKVFHSNLLNDLKCLRRLKFSNNKIEQIQTNSFKDITSIEFIDFSHNGIIKLDKNVFNGLDCLINIDFRYNKIKQIDRNIFKKLEKLKIISLHENEINDPNHCMII